MAAVANTGFVSDAAKNTLSSLIEPRPRPASTCGHDALDTAVDNPDRRARDPVLVQQSGKDLLEIDGHNSLLRRRLRRRRVRRPQNRQRVEPGVSSAVPTAVTVRGVSL